MSDDLALVARGRKIAGWEEISVTLSCEAFPNSFDIKLSARDPDTNAAVIAAAGDPCQIFLGNDLVITGYIDRDTLSGDSDGHQLQLIGRGKCQDIADCSAEWDSNKGLVSGDALQISTELAKVYGIDCVLVAGASAGEPIPGWALNYGETAGSIVQRVAQNAGLLVYEDNAGRLTLSTIGSTRASSGVVYGQNVETFSIQNAMDQRFSQVVCANFSLAAFDDLPGSDFFNTQFDPNVLRHRQIDLVLEDVASEDAHVFCIRKAKWEIARRAGRSTSVSATVDSWRDAQGKLWQPNSLVPVTLPGLRTADSMLCLSQVTFRRSESGTRAELLLMPKQAFELEPITLLPVNTADLSGPG